MHSWCACRCAYTNWTTSAKDCNDFYTDVNAIKLYKQHVKRVLKRVNTVTGVAYANDPTILGKHPAVPPLLLLSMPPQLINMCLYISASGNIDLRKDFFALPKSAGLFSD